jgi:hypothetical protein
MDIDERSATVDEARSLVREMSSLTDFNDEGFDATIVIPKGGFSFNQPALSDDVILDRLFDFKLDPDKISQTIQNLPENLFVCPACKNELKNEDNGWFCLNCAEKYLKVENVPVFISSRPVQKPEQQSLINAGVDPAGFEYIKNIFKPEYLRASPMLKATYVLGLMFHLLVRFVRSRVPWRIKYKWFVNKVGLSTIRSYYFK